MRDAKAICKFDRCMAQKTGQLQRESYTASWFQNLPYPSKDIFCQNCATDLEFGAERVTFRLRAAAALWHLAINPAG
jgi:hypothetical protein